jgi:hypothetical protein
LNSVLIFGRGSPQLIKLKDLVGFIGTSFKVPLLVHQTTEVRINSGTCSARQLLDAVAEQLINFERREGALPTCMRRFWTTTQELWGRPFCVAISETGKQCVKTTG